MLHSSVYSETNTALVSFKLAQSEVFENIGGIDSISVDFADGNTFENNTVGVSFQSLEKLELQQGHNTFSQQVIFDLVGSFVPSASISYNGS